MESIYIHGGIRLQGQVRIQGSKNAVLPVLAATILTKGKNTIRNCPKLTDVFCMQTLLKNIGCRIHFHGTDLRVDATDVDLLRVSGRLKGEAVCSMRSSITLLGALLGRFGEAYLEYPGGCVIGERPIDIHLMALKKFGVTFEEDAGGIHAFCGELTGTNVKLPFPSVGATENIVLIGVSANGKTVIEGAAREPEIVALCEFLRLAGAKIYGDGTDRIEIEGGLPLHGTEYAVPGDRIVAGTYMCACLAAGGEVFLREAPTDQMAKQLYCAEQMGARCQTEKDGLYVQMSERPCAVPYIRTEPYPGFPTDMQSLFLAVAAVAKGDCLMEETIFENRFHILPYLEKMGAEIEIIDTNKVRVKGVDTLQGNLVEAKELRGGAALIVAGIAAKDITIVEGCKYIERGYENICRDLRELGVRIYGV